MNPSMSDIEMAIEQAWKKAVVSKNDFKALSFLLARDKMKKDDDFMSFDDHLMVEYIDDNNISIIYNGDDVLAAMTFRDGFKAKPIDFELTFDDYPWQFFDDEGYIAILSEDSLAFLGSGIREPGKEDRGSNLCIFSN